MLDRYREGVSDDLLVASVHAETHAGYGPIRETVDRMQRHGAIYDAGGDRGTVWRATRL